MSDIYIIRHDIGNGQRGWKFSRYRYCLCFQTTSVQEYSKVENDLKNLSENLNLQKPRTDYFFKQIIGIAVVCDCLFLQVPIAMIINNFIKVHSNNGTASSEST